MSEGEPSLSPRIRAVLDSCHAGVKREFYWLDSLSCLDSYTDSFADWIDPPELAPQVTKLAQQAAARAMHVEPSAASSSSSSVQSFGTGVIASSSDVGRRSKIVSKPYELQPLASGDPGSSSKKSEAVKIDEWAQCIVDFMPDSVKQKFLPGRGSMPAEVYDDLVFQSVRGTAQTDQLRSSFYALQRLHDWLRVRFSPFHQFAVPDAYMAWFLRENLVSGETHVSQSLVSGLRFAEQTLKFPFSVSSSSLRALSKGPTRTPKQAPSASLRVAHHFWEVASNSAYSTPLRGVSAVFLVMCLAALRGIDAQRSSFDSECGGGSSYSFFTAVAFNSKRRVCMPWACPIIVFGASSEWYTQLRKVWGSRDFMFPAVSRGTSLAAASCVLNTMASSFLIIRYLREILSLPSLAMSASDAERMRRHSFRHWIANLMRVLKFQWSDLFTGGRWKEQSVMPLRYSQEVQFVASVDLIVRVIQACEKAISEFPLESWPIYGGWERFLPDRRFAPGEPVVMAYDQAPSDSGSDSSEDEDDGSNVRPIRPFSQRELPDGWSRSERHLESGRVIPCYHGPNGESARSLVEAWRVVSAAPRAFGPPLGTVALASISVSQRVRVWWTGDAVFYSGSVALVDGDLFTVDYDDGQTLTHAFSDSFVADELSNEPASDSSVVAAPPSGPAGASSAAPAAAQSSAPPKPSTAVLCPPFPSTQCGVPDCIVPSVNGHHNGIHVFPEPKPRRRSSS